MIRQIPRNRNGMMYEKKVLLDTCALLWLAAGEDRISQTTLQVIQRASIVFVSAISSWEISLKYERQQLILPMEPELWFLRALEAHSLVLAPLDVSVLCHANKLPRHHHDPADRFIISTAILENAAIVTSDTKFLKYDIRVLY